LANKINQGACPKQGWFLFSPLSGLFCRAC